MLQVAIWADVAPVVVEVPYSLYAPSMSVDSLMCHLAKKVAIR
jgi:hypothetical protein